MFKDSFKYLVFTLLEKGGWLLFLPYLTSLLTPDEFGEFSYFTLIHTFIYILLSFSLSNSIGRIFYDKSKIESFEMAKIFEFSIHLFALFFPLFISCFFYFSIYYFNFDLSMLIDEKYVLPLLIVISFQPFIEVSKTFKQVKRDVYGYGFISLSVFFFKIIVGFYLIINYEYKGEGLAYGLGLAYIFIFIVYIIQLLSKLNNFKLDYNLIIESLTYSSKLIIHNISNWFIGSVDRICLKIMSGIGALGIYSFSYQIASVVTILADSINQAWSPIMYKNIPTIDGRVYLAKLGNLLLFTFSIFCLILIFLSDYIIRFLFDSSYMASIEYIPILVMVSLISSYSYMVGATVVYYKPSNMSYITLLSASLNIILNIFLIPIYGVMGAIISTLIQKIITFLSNFYFAEKINEKINYNYKAMFATFACLLCMYFIKSCSFELYIEFIGLSIMILLIIIFYINDIKNIKYLWLVKK